MGRHFVKNVLFVLIINILIKPVWIFFIDRNVQIKVGYEVYGTYQALFNLGIIFQILLDFGLTQYNSREVSRDPGRMRIIFSSMFWMRMLLVLVYMLAVSVMAWCMGYSGWKLQLLMGVLLIQALSSMLLFVRSNISGLHHFRTDGILAVTDRMLMILLCGPLMLIPATSASFRIEWFVWSQVICYLVAVLIAFVILFRIAPAKLHFSFRPKIIQRVIRSSAPYALLVFLMSIYQRIDMVMIDRLCGQQGETQAGIYAAAFRLLDVANIFGVMFAGVLLPLFGRMLSRREDVAPVLRTSVNIMMPLAFIVTIVSGSFAGDIMHLLYHKARVGNSDGIVFALLLSTFPAYCIMYIYSTLLTANGNIKTLNKVSFILVVLNIGLNACLIPRYFSAGAAFTACITEWCAAAAAIYYCHRKLILPHNPKWILTHVAYVAALLLGICLVCLLPVSWMLQCASFILLAGILLFVFRFWTISSLKSLLRKNNDLEADLDEQL